MILKMFLDQFCIWSACLNTFSGYHVRLVLKPADLCSANLILNFGMTALICLVNFQSFSKTKSSFISQFLFPCLKPLHRMPHLPTLPYLFHQKVSLTQFMDWRQSRQHATIPAVLLSLNPGAKGNSDSAFKLHEN